MNAFFYPSKRGINFAKIRGFKVTDYKQSGAPGPDLLTRSCRVRPFAASIYIDMHIPLAATLDCCSDIANLSAHLHRLPTPPPYLRRMRLLPGRECTIGSN